MFARVHFLLVSEGLCGCLANVFGRQGHRLLLRGCRSWSPLQSHLVAVCVCVCVCWDSCLFCLCVQQPRIQSNDTVFSVFLQVYIRILDNEWNVYRRYTEFRELHNHLRTPFPQVAYKEKDLDTDL